MDLPRAAILLLLCLCVVHEIQGGLLDILKGDDKKDDHQNKSASKSKKESNPSLMNSMQGLMSSVATGDRIKTLIVLVDVELADKKMHPIVRFQLKLTKKALQWFHPIYLKMFPDKADRGSVGGNVSAGAEGIVSTMKTAGKMAQTLGNTFLSRYLS